MQKAFAKKISKKLHPEKENIHERKETGRRSFYFFFPFCLLSYSLPCIYVFFVPSLVVLNILLTLVLTFIYWLF